MEKVEITLSHAEEGMQLAEDVIDNKGVSLITSGSQLNKALIDILKKRNIESLIIYQSQELTDEEREHMLEKIKQQLDQSFRKVENNSLMQDLKQMILTHHTRKL